MPYTPVRDIELIDVGSLGKETLSNDAFANLAHGISGTATIPLAATDHTLSTPEGLAFVLILTGTLTAHVNLIVPAESRVYVVDNRTTGAFTVTCRPAAGGGVAVDQSARTLIYGDGSNVYPVASGTGGGGGGGAPTDASYLVGASHTLLSGERVVTDTSTITWDFATAGQAKALIPPDGVSYTHIQNVSSSRLLGRFTAGAGEVQEITPGTGLALDAGTGVLSATAVGQPLDATLTALAGVTTAADTLEYFTGVDVAASTPLTPLARTLLDDTTQAAMQATIGVVPGTQVQPFDATLTAIAGVTTGADTLQFFTGVDTASTTPFSPLARALLDDTTQAAMQATIGVTGGGGGSTDFLGLTDTPNSYAGQTGKAVVVNGAATGLDFTTAATGSYDLGLTWGGVLPASQVLMRYPFPRAVDFPAGLSGSQGLAAVAATATTTLDLRKNGTSVGSVSFAAAGTTATFTMASATSFAAGDVLTVHAPVSADATLADLGLSLAGTRAVGAGEMGATTWLGLTDTPDSYAGQGSTFVRVNAAATALEFVAQDPELAALSLLTSAADRVPYYTGSGTAALATFTAAGRTLAGAADAAAQRTALALGTMATQDAGAVAITGGTATGLTGFANGSGDAYIWGLRVGSGTIPTSQGQLEVGGKAQFDNAITGDAAVTIRHRKATANAIELRSVGTDTGGVAMAFFNISGGYAGGITTTATAVSYNTSSDVRLKHAIAPLTGALDVVQALRPISHRWKADDSRGVGFLAHEVAEVVEGVITGEKDAVDEGGNILPQMIDYSKLVPFLVGAVKTLSEHVEALTARLDAAGA